MSGFRGIACGLVVLVLVGAAIQFGMSLGMVSGPQSGRGPRLQLVTDHVDLGRIAPHTTAVARFVIANPGHQPLVFRRSVRGQQPPPVTRIEPGRTGEIALELEAWELAGGARRFRFLTNDPARPEFWLTVRASVGESPRVERSVLIGVD